MVQAAIAAKEKAKRLAREEEERKKRVTIEMERARQERLRQMEKPVTQPFMGNPLAALELANRLTGISQ